MIDLGIVLGGLVLIGLGGLAWCGLFDRHPGQHADRLPPDPYPVPRAPEPRPWPQLDWDGVDISPALAPLPAFPARPIAPPRPRPYVRPLPPGVVRLLDGYASVDAFVDHLFARVVL